MRDGAQTRQKHRHGESRELPGRGDSDRQHCHWYSELEAPFAGWWKDRGNRAIELPDDAGVGDPAWFERFNAEGGQDFIDSGGVDEQIDSRFRIEDPAPGGTGGNKRQCIRKEKYT